MNTKRHSISEKTRKKLSDSWKWHKGNYEMGNIPWNKGLSGKKYLKHYNSGKIWNAGLNKENSEILKRISENFKGNKNPAHRVEIRKKISSSWTGVRRKKQSEKMKNNHPMKKPEIAKKQGETLKKTYKEYPELSENVKKRMLDWQAAHMNSLVCNPSKPQIKLFNYIKNFFPSAKMNFPIKIREQKCYSLDVAIPELKICYEYNEPYWHDKIQDGVRTDNLIELGWCVVNINGIKDLKVMLND